MLAAVLRGISTGLLCLAVPVVLWQLIIGLQGLFPMIKRPVLEEKKHRFAVIICARNEEKVIGSLLDSLYAQQYPQDCFTVFVVADNCTDGTAQEARRHGAIVYERFDETRRGKGYALSWVFERLREEYPDRFDAAAFFDADNLAAPDFLDKMNDALCAGADVAQGYRDTKNVEDSAVSACYAVYWQSITRFYHRARYNCGLPCMVCGTGFVCRWACVADGWHTRSLVEDNEFSIQQTNKGSTIVPVYDAVFYDEQPVTWRTSFRQRFRWLAGGIQCMKYELPNSLRALRRRPLAVLDGIMYMFSLVFLGLSVLGGSLWLAALVVETLANPSEALRPDWIWLIGLMAAGLLFIWLFALLTVLVEHKPLRRYWKGIVLYPVFLVPMGYMALVALFHPRTEWKPIVHNRAYTMADMPEQKKRRTKPLDSAGGNVL